MKHATVKLCFCGRQIAEQVKKPTHFLRTTLLVLLMLESLLPDAGLAGGKIRQEVGEHGEPLLTNHDGSAHRRSVDGKTYYRKEDDASNTTFFTDMPDRFGGWEKFLEGTSRSGSRFKDYIRNANLYDKDILELAAEHHVPPALVKAIMMAESAFNPRALSPKGAQGLMQLMPGTARLVGVRDAWDARQNIEGGTRYIKQMLMRFDGNTRKAIAAYNAGPGNVDKYGGVPPFEETQAYVERVEDLYERFQANDLSLQTAGRK